MKKSITYYSILTLFISAFLLFVNFLPARSQNQEISEGKEYWLGIPHCKMLELEEIRGEYPIVIWVSSKVDTKATVTDIQTGNIVTKPIKKNQITSFPMGDHLMNRESEIITNNGIHVVADDPISVTVYLSYKWSGEAYRVIPIEWLGKEYYTLNLYQDRTDEYKPAQILVVATKDNTVLKYRPTAATVKKNKGELATVTLQKGQCYLIEGKIIPALNQNWLTDLTGTYIYANKPVAVISGHTKGAFPLYNHGMPNGYHYIWANFLRNMLCDMMWPVELLGTEYVSVPIYYNNRPRGLTSVQDDKGDLIRFVASADNTQLMQMRKDGTGFMKIGPTLKKGEWYNVTNQENPALYKSNKPVLVGQYGKTWWDTDVPGRGDIAKKDGDSPQNPNRNGQGMVLVLAPIDHWCGYAPFKAPDEIDDFFYITYDSSYRNKIYFDGVKITTKFGSSVQIIKGTPYEYVVSQINPGDHWIEGKEGAKFAAYAYGNWDRCKDGFAYGYPIGVNFASTCKDTLVMTDTIVCGTVNGNAVASDLQTDTTCAEIFYCGADNLVNYDFTDNFVTGTKTVGFTLSIIDPKLPASGTVKVMTRSGKSITRNYVYIPEQIEVTPSIVDFGVLKENESKCITVTIKNTGTVDATVKKLRLKNANPPEGNFEIKPADINKTLKPGETVTFEACVTALLYTTDIIKNYVIAELSCFEQEIDTLQFKMGDPAVWIGDATWKDIPVGQLVPKTVEIINRSNVEVVLNSITWDDKLHFPKVDGLDDLANNPLHIPAKETRYFTAYYVPDVPGVPHTDTAYFTGNTDKDKLYSIWIGNGINAGPYIEGYNWLRRRVIDKYNDSTQYKWSVMINNTSISGTRLDVTDVVVNDPDNVFSINRGDIPVQLNPKEPRYITAFFSPKAEKAYQVEVTLKSTFNGEPQEVSGMLEGIGELPHINVEDHDFRPKIQVNDSRQGIVVISNHKNVYPMELTIKEISIDGPDKASFVIDPAWLAGNPMPIKIPVDGTINVPVKFTALHGGIHNARIVTKNDAPDPGEPLAFNEKPTGDLIGEGFSEGIVTTDYDFQTIFRTTTKTGGKVYLQNNGTDPITINNDIRTGIVDNANGYIKVDRWYTELGGLVNPAAGFELGAGDKLWVETTYSPAKEGSHSIQIVYDYNDGQKAISNVIGKANLIRTIARIPKDKYISTLTDRMPLEIEFMIDRPASTIEDKPLELADIKSFIARVHFNSQPSLNLKVQDVYPVVNGPADIKLTDMTSGWTCESATIVDNRILEVKMTSNEALKLNTDSEVLFKFNMSCYLSDLDVVPLPCEFIPLGAPAGYVVVDTIPGNIKVNPVCVNTLRLIKFIDGVSSLMTNTPNPVTDKTTIQYQVGEKGPVSIMLYDNLGNKIATLIDQQQDKGLYTFVLDVNQLSLPAGVYIYKLTCGGQTDSKTMVVTK